MIRKRTGPALVLKNIFCMLSVNSSNSAIWYQDWHGAYVRSLEDH